MRGDLRFRLLKVIGIGFKTAKALAMLLDESLPKKKSIGQVFRDNDRLRVRLLCASVNRRRAVEEFRKAFNKRKQIADALYQLKKEGFLIEGKKDKNNQLVVSGKGERLKKLLEKKTKLAPPDVSRYQVEKDPILKIISFDVPQKISWKRAWLRSALHRLGFKMIHQSFWAGTAKIPVDFLSDMATMKIVDCVEIFAVSKEGTLKKIS